MKNILDSFKILLAAALLMSTYAYANCDKTFISNIANQIGTKVDEYTYPQLFSCVVIENQGINVLAFAVYNSNLTKKDTLYKDSTSGDGLYDLTVVVANKNNNEIIAKHIGFGILWSDAVALSNLSINTKYNSLNKQSLIFDVVTTNKSNSNAYISYSTTLFLFELNKNNLTQLINGLYSSNYSGNLEVDPDKNIFNYMERKLKFTKNNSSNKPNILITEINCQTNNETGDCKGIANTKKLKHLLKFDGKKYPIPKKLNN
jgi:hypothetical protein